jgi:flagellar basal body-associated protein FliL
MRKTSIGPILAVIAVLLVAAMFVYFYLSLNKLEKKAVEIQTTAVTDAGKLSAVVNFFNSNLNAQTNK